MQKQLLSDGKSDTLFGSLTAKTQPYPFLDAKSDTHTTFKQEKRFPSSF